MGDLAGVWERLQADGLSREGYVRLRLSSVRSCAAYAARRLSDGLEALVLEVRTSSLPASPSYPQSVGFEVLTGVLQPGRSGSTRLLLTLTHERFRDVFHTLCDDVVRSIGGASSEVDAVHAFISRLTRWQDFLRRHHPGGLSPEERRGLYGELSFLRDLVSTAGAADAVRAWRGCRGANHDFALDHGSTEVKTSSANTPHSFRVANIGQLDDNGVEALFLLHVRVAESDSAGESLPDLIDSIRSILDPVADAEFEESMIEAGYLHAQRELYTAPQYQVRGRRFFRVTEGFPRLLGSLLPDGVEDVEYSVAIAACVPFECSADEVFARLLRRSGPGPS